MVPLHVCNSYYGAKKGCKQSTLLSVCLLISPLEDGGGEQKILESLNQV